MKYPSANLVYEEIKFILSLQYDAFKSLTTRLQIIIGFNSVVVAAILQFYNKNDYNFFVLAGLIFIIVATTIALVGHQAQKLKRAPDPEVLLNDYVTKDEAETKRTLIGTWVSDYKKNEEVVKNVSNIIFITTLLTGIGIIFISLQIVSEEVIKVCFLK